MVWGEAIVDRWVGPHHFVGYYTVLPLVVCGVLEVHHIINSAFVWSAGRWPFAPWSIASGIATSILGYWWVGALGCAGMAWASCISQMVTNNWFVVWTSLRSLRIPVRAYARDVLVPLAGMIVGIAVAAVAIKVGVERALTGYGPAARTGEIGIALGVLLTTLTAAFVFWRCGLSREGRESVVTRCNAALQALQVRYLGGS